MKINVKQKVGEIVICDAEVEVDFLDNVSKLRQLCISALKKGHCNIIKNKIMFHQFKDDKHEGNGITGLIIISESHFHISTWPEFKKKYVQIDINTCGESAKPFIVLGFLLHELKAKNISVSVKDRGF